jgi:peroxiredoxin Q/BCP
VSLEKPVFYNVGFTGDMMPLRIGDAAPNFELRAVSGEREYTVRLSDYVGKQHVVVTFHPIDWTPT